MVLKGFKIPVLITLLLLLAAPNLRAQNALDDIEEEDRADTALSAEQAPNLVSETIKVISPSKKFLF